MRRKILFYTLIFFITLLFSSESVSAVRCVYEQPDTGRKIELKVKTNNVDVYQNGKKVNCNINFVISENSTCPPNIYSALSTCNLYSKQNDTGSLKELKLIKSIATKVSCGNITGIPVKIPQLVSEIITIIQIAIPVILVIMGTLDLFKGITAQKDDEIKKGQQMFIKRLIVAALIFFIVVIVKFLISIVEETTSANIIECIDCFISNDCK